MEQRPKSLLNIIKCRMSYSGMLCCVAVVRTDVSEERITSIINVIRIVELGTTLIVTRNRSTLQRNSIPRLLVTDNIPSLPILLTLMIEMICSSETSILTSSTRRNIPEDDIFHSHRPENLKSYIIKCHLYIVKNPFILDRAWRKTL
jgi:hypothetical protein